MEPEDLIADLDKELREVLGALQGFAPVTEDVVVSDETQTVSVTVRPDMTLAAVQVQPVWAEKVQPDTLAGVISELLGRAQAKAMGFDVDALDEGRDPHEVVVDEAEVEAARERLLKEKTEELLAPVGEEELQARIDELPAQMDELISKLDVEIEKMQSGNTMGLPEDPAEFEPDESYGDWVHSENRMVGVRVVAGMVADVEIRTNWVEGRSGNVLTECFNQIIEQLPEVVAAQNEQGVR